MVTFRSPKRDPRGLLQHGPRIEIEIGPPIVRTSSGLLSPRVNLPAAGGFSNMPALIDTGAGNGPDTGGRRKSGPAAG